MPYSNVLGKQATKAEWLAAGAKEVAGPYGPSLQLSNSTHSDTSPLRKFDEPAAPASAPVSAPASMTGLSTAAGGGAPTAAGGVPTVGSGSATGAPDISTIMAGLGSDDPGSQMLGTGSGNLRVLGQRRPAMQSTALAGMGRRVY